MIYNKILISLFLFLSNWLIAQDMIVYNENKSSEIIFNYSPYKNDNSLPNYFISSMANSQSRIRSYYTFKISANIHSVIKKTKNDNYNIIINVDSLQSTGNYNYKGFNFSRLILPSIIKFKYSLIEINTNKSTDYFTNLDIGNKQNYTIKNNYFDSTRHGAFKLDNESLVYKYTTNQKSDFDSAISLIDNYYSDGKKLLLLQKDIKKLDPSNIDKIKLQNIDLKYITKRFSKIQINNYASKLSLELSDPAGYYRLYSILNSQIKDYRNQFSRNLSSLDSLFYLKGMQFKKDSLFQTAVLYFNKSLNINPYFIPSLYQLALIDFQNQNLIGAENKITKILDLNTNNNIYNKLANNTYLALLQKGKEYNNKENYNEGLKILNKAKVFCNKHKNIIDCDSMQNTAIREAIYGMYSSYLSIAGAAMQRGRLDMTEDYLNIADKYRQENADAITNIKELSALYTLLVTEYLSKSIEDNKNYKFQKSKISLLYADSLSKKHMLNDAITFVAEVKKQLENNDDNQFMASNSIISNKQKIIIQKGTLKTESPQEKARDDYANYYDKGCIYYIYHRYQQAYQELKVAKTIQQKYNIIKIDSLDSYLKQSARNIIKKNLETASLYIWGSKYSSAEFMIKKAQEDIVNNNLETDIELSNKIKELRAKLQKQQNSNTSNLFKAKMLKARQSIGFKDFISLEKYCNEAIEISKQNTNIPLDSNYPVNLLKKYREAIDFQKAMQKAEWLKYKGSFQKAISQLTTANNIYDKEALQNYKLRKTSIYTFATTNSNIELVEASITNLLKAGHANTALDIWREALGNNWQINPELAKNIMTQIAKIDKDRNVEGDKKEMYNQRFGKNSTFAKYRKYYFKSFVKQHNQ